MEMPFKNLPPTERLKIGMQIDAAMEATNPLYKEAKEIARRIGKVLRDTFRSQEPSMGMTMGLLFVEAELSIKMSIQSLRLLDQFFKACSVED